MRLPLRALIRTALPVCERFVGRFHFADAEQQDGNAQQGEDAFSKGFHRGLHPFVLKWSKEASCLHKAVIGARGNAVYHDIRGGEN